MVRGRRESLLAVVSLSVCVVLGAVAVRAEASTPKAAGSLAEVLPEGAIAFAEVTDLGPLLERIRGSELWKALQKDERIAQLRNSPQFRKADAGRRILEGQLGMDLWTLGTRVLGYRVGVALYPRPDGGDEPDLVGIVRVRDGDVLRDLRQRVQPFLDLADNVVVNDRGDGIETFDFDGQLFAAVGPDWVCASNRSALLEQTVEALNKPSRQNTGRLAAEPAFQKMTSHLGADHLVRGYVNTGMIAQAMGGRFTPQKLDNPLGSLLLGGLLELANNTPYAGLTLDIGERDFMLRLGVAGNPRKLDEAHQVFFARPGEQGVPPMPQPEGFVGGLSLYRDFANWYRHRDDLLVERLLPEFDKFETGLSNLLPGKDVGEDVFPLFGNTFTLVAVRQSYAHLKGEPGIKLPGFAAIVELRKPQEATDLLQLFFQTLMAVLNFEAGQQGREPWLLSAEPFEGVTILHARYLQTPTGQDLPIVFNFAPASARVGNRFVLASSLETCRQLVRELKQPGGNGVGSPTRNLDFILNPPQLAELIEANAGLIVARGVQQGRPADRVRADLDGGLKLLRALKPIRLSTLLADETAEVRLEAGW